MLTKIDRSSNDTRVVTGPTQFGDDWPGYFIRGDEALGMAGRFEKLAQSVNQKWFAECVAKVLQEHADELRKCAVREAT